MHFRISVLISHIYNVWTRFCFLPVELGFVDRYVLRMQTFIPDELRLVFIKAQGNNRVLVLTHFALRVLKYYMLFYMLFILNPNIVFVLAHK